MYVGVARPAAIGACDPQRAIFFAQPAKNTIGHQQQPQALRRMALSGGAPFSGLLERFRKDHHTPDTAFSEHCSMFSVTMPDGEQTGPPVAMQRGSSQTRSWGCTPTLKY